MIASLLATTGALLVGWLLRACPALAGRNTTITYDFEDDLDGWKHSPSTFYRWGEQSGYSPQVNGPSSAYSGLDYLHIHTNNNFPRLGTTTEVESPCFGLGGYTNPSISFWYHILGIHYPSIENPGSLELQVSTDYGATWTTFWSRNYGTSGQ